MGSAQLALPAQYSEARTACWPYRCGGNGIFLHASKVPDVALPRLCEWFANLGWLCPSNPTQPPATWRQKF
jgi:hypothetical protein